MPRAAPGHGLSGLIVLARGQKIAHDPSHAPDSLRRQAARLINADAQIRNAMTPTNIENSPVAHVGHEHTAGDRADVESAVTTVAQIHEATPRRKAGLTGPNTKSQEA